MSGGARTKPIPIEAIARERALRMPVDYGRNDLEGELLLAIRGHGIAEPIPQYRWAWCCPHERKRHGVGVPGRESGVAVVCVGYYPLPIAYHDYAHDRDFRADFAWPAARLLVECEGGIEGREAHGSITGIWHDIDRGNQAVLR